MTLKNDDSSVAVKTRIEIASSSDSLSRDDSLAHLKCRGSMTSLGPLGPLRLLRSLLLVSLDCAAWFKNTPGCIINAGSSCKGLNG